MNVNILFLGGAKRVAIGRRLIEAATSRGFQANIFGYELDPKVPLAAIGTIITGKRWNDPELDAHLHEVVEKYDIDILLPFVDGAIAKAAAFATTRSKVFCPVSDAEICETFFDKVLSAKAFLQAGLDIPETWKPGTPPLFPLIAKPRCGSASKGIEIIETPEQLAAIRPTMDNYLIQKYISNACEITVDCYVAATGEILAVSPRERLETAGGEAVRTITIDSPQAIALAEKTLQRLNLRGAVTVQMLRDAKGNLMIMEINPRLGGGVVASINAGADIASLIIDEWASLPLKRLYPMPGVLTVRYLNDIAFLPDGTQI